MSAESVIYYLNLNREPLNEPVDETEWLFSALGQFTSAELRELLYVAQEPGFFEMMRAVFALSDPGRAMLQDFLTASDPRPVNASIDVQGRCILDRGTPEHGERSRPRIVE